MYRKSLRLKASFDSSAVGPSQLQLVLVCLYRLLKGWRAQWAPEGPGFCCYLFTNIGFALFNLLTKSSPNVMYNVCMDMYIT